MGSGIYWYLVVAVTILLAVSATTRGRDATDCSPRKHLPCTIVKPGCIPDARPPPKEGWPNKPRDLNVTVFMKGYGFRSYMVPGLNITWRIPDDRSYKSIKGFQLTLSVMSGYYAGRQLCRTFDLSRAQWDTSDLREKVMFYYDGVYPCVQGTTYYVSLYSLPKSDGRHAPNNAVSFVVTPRRQYYNRPDTYRWLTSMSITFDTASNRVDVWFNLAPPDYRFVEYSIMLIDATSGVSNQWTDKTKVVVRKGETGVRHVVFLNVCTGKYRIFVQPKNTGKYTHNCVCKNYWGTCQEFCRVSASSIFKFVSGLPCIPKVSKRDVIPTQDSRSPVTKSLSFHNNPAVASEDPNGDKMTVIIVGVVLGMILLAIASYSLLRPGRNCESCPPWKKPQTIAPTTVTYDLANHRKKGDKTPILRGYYLDDTYGTNEPHMTPLIHVPEEGIYHTSNKPTTRTYK